MEVAEESETVRKETKKEPDMEAKITGAIRARVGYFSEQADSLTLEGVRRLLEKDLGLEKWALDAHKRFVKQYLQECFDAAAADLKSKNSGETGGEIVSSTGEESTNLSDGRNSRPEMKEPSSEDEEKMGGSPVLGLVTRGEPTHRDSGKTSDGVIGDSPSDDTIKKAIKKRASYFRAHSETVTMKEARRLLEEDLKLDKNALDPFKKLISEQLNKVFESPEAAKTTNGVEKSHIKNDSHSKASKKVSSEGSSDVSCSDEEDKIDEDEVKPKKKTAPKGKTQNSEGLKKREASVNEMKKPSNKRSKPAETMAEESNDAKDDGNSSESSAEKPVKKKREVSTQTYGKRVEHLKSIIKACAMTVPPSVYKRAKQSAEGRREAFLIKELEEILGREGLGKNPSEKEIKEVRKKKERAKELEGIDMKNIVPCSRRRSTVSFAAPPQPKASVEHDGKDGGDSDEDKEDDENDDNEASNSEGSSEGFNEDVEDESD